MTVATTTLLPSAFESSAGRVSPQERFASFWKGAKERGTRAMQFLGGQDVTMFGHSGADTISWKDKRVGRTVAAGAKATAMHLRRPAEFLEERKASAMKDLKSGRLMSWGRKTAAYLLPHLAVGGARGAAEVVARGEIEKGKAARMVGTAAVGFLIGFAAPVAGVGVAARRATTLGVNTAVQYGVESQKDGWGQLSWRERVAKMNIPQRLLFSQMSYEAGVVGREMLSGVDPIAAMDHVVGSTIFGNTTPAMADGLTPDGPSDTKFGGVNFGGGTGVASTEQNDVTIETESADNYVLDPNENKVTGETPAAEPVEEPIKYSFNAQGDSKISLPDGKALNVSIDEKSHVVTVALDDGRGGNTTDQFELDYDAKTGRIDVNDPDLVTLQNRVGYTFEFTAHKVQAELPDLSKYQMNTHIKYDDGFGDMIIKGNNYGMFKEIAPDLFNKNGRLDWSGPDKSDPGYASGSIKNDGVEGFLHWAAKHDSGFQKLVEDGVVDEHGADLWIMKDNDWGEGSFNTLAVAAARWQSLRDGDIGSLGFDVKISAVEASDVASGTKFGQVKFDDSVTALEQGQQLDNVESADNYVLDNNTGSSTTSLSDQEETFTMDYSNIASRANNPIDVRELRGNGDSSSITLYDGVGSKMYKDVPVIYKSDNGGALEFTYGSKKLSVDFDIKNPPNSKQVLDKLAKASGGAFDASKLSVNR